MSNFNNELVNYQSIPRDLIFDTRLSDRARFVYCYMSAKPDGWNFFLSHMSEELGYSRKTLQKYINELIAGGWLEKGEQQKDCGRFGAPVYTLKSCSPWVISPQGNFSATEKNRYGKNDLHKDIDIIEKRDIYNIEKKDNNKENIKRKKETPKDDNFEKCWEAYRRKGSKKKAREYWNKLSDEEKALVLPHVKVYASTREVKFQKDFERYLRDKIFNEVVYNGNTMMYDPQMFIGDEYRPAGINIFEKDGKNWTFAYSLKMIDDGYTDEDRPDGAELTLHNDRGTIRWKAAQRRWVHI